VKYFPLSAVDDELVAVATELLMARFVEGRHHVAAAIRTETGATVTGLHVGSRRINICAEQVALGNILTNGIGSPVAVASVIMMTSADTPSVTSPCGVCREVLSYYNPDLTALIREADETRKTSISELLPAPWLLPDELAERARTTRIEESSQ
jgi:cytidine deaminase